MFSLFRKKTPPAVVAPAPEELPASAAPLAEAPQIPSPLPVDEDEPLLTWEELDALEGRVPTVKKSEPAPLAAAAAPVAAVPAPAPAPAPYVPEPERTPLERALDRCEADPHDANLVHDAARLAYAAKKPEAAVAPLLRTATLLAQSDPETALDLLTRLANMGQGSRQSTQVMLEICRFHPHSASSEHAIRGILKAAPENVEALLVHADMQLGARRYPDAIATLNQVSTLSPGDAPACEKRGDAYALLGEMDRALESWLQAAERFEKGGAAEEAHRLREQVELLRAAQAAQVAVADERAAPA